MLRRFYVQKVLCSENICSKGSMFRRFYIQKVLCSEGSMFRSSYIQKVLCSEGPMFRKKLFKRSYIQKVLCSNGIRRLLNGLCSITEVKQRRARFIIEWVTAWDCQVLYTLVGLREPRKSDGLSY